MPMISRGGKIAEIDVESAALEDKPAVEPLAEEGRLQRQADAEGAALEDEPAACHSGQPNEWNAGLMGGGIMQKFII